MSKLGKAALGLVGGGMFDKPDKPEMPESEKILIRHQAKLGKKGTALASRVGDKFVANINRDRKTRAQGTASADVAKSQKLANQSVKGDPIKVITNASRGGSALAKNMAASAAGGVSERTQRQSAGSAAALNISSSVTKAGLHVANLENQRSLDKMHREFERANQLVDIAGVAAGTMAQAPAGAAKPPTGSMSVANPNGLQMSSIVDPNDPFSNPLPNVFGG